MNPKDWRQDPFDNFAGPLTLSHYDAAQRATGEFLDYFPGWELYARIVRGNDVNDRKLMAWAIGCARALSRANKTNGRAYIGECARGRWVRQAGLDALDYAIYGKYPAGLTARALQFNVADKTYQKVRDVAAISMWLGFENYASLLHSKFREVKRQEKSIS